MHPIIGVVYLSAGVNEATASLYRLTTQPFDFRVVFQAPAGRGIDSVAGADNTVIVSEQGDIDRVTSGGLQPIHGLPARSVVPVPLPNERLAFITHFTPHRPDGSRLPTRFQLNILNLSTGVNTVVLDQVQDIEAFAFGGRGGLVAVTELTPSRTGYELRMLNADGSSKVSPLAGPVLPAWDAAGDHLLLSDVAHSEATVLNADGQEVARLHGWRGLTWSPDGGQVLVTRGTELALWTSTIKAGTPRALGSVAIPGSGGATAQVFAAAWVRSDAS